MDTMLDQVELAMALEEEFDIRISNIEWNALHTVSQMVEFVTGKLEAK